MDNKFIVSLLNINDPPFVEKNDEQRS